MKFKATRTKLNLNLTKTKYSLFGQVDVFSFGIVMWEILTGEEPYADMHCGAIIGKLLY